MFLENEYFFSVSTERKEISVVRVGSCEHEVVVRYETEAFAQLDGGVSKHVSSTGTVTFVAGDAFEVLPILTDSDGPWQLMESFKVQLLEVVSGPAVIGPLASAQVYLVDEDGFPTDEIGHAFSYAQLHGTPEPGPYRLLFWFINLCWRVHWRLLGCALMGQVYGGVHLILKEVIILIGEQS